MRFRSPHPAVAAALLLLRLCTTAPAQTATGPFQVRQLQGTATLLTARGVTGNLINGAQPGMSDRLATAADSSFVLDVDDSVSLWIGPESSVTVDGSTATGLRVALQRGCCVIDMKQRERTARLFLTTPLGAIRSEGGIAMIRLPADGSGKLTGLMACVVEGQVRLDLHGNPHAQPAIPAGKLFDSRQQPAGQHPARATLHDIPAQVVQEVTEAARMIARPKE